MPLQSWRRSRYGFVGFCFLSLVLCWSVLRVALLIAFPPPAMPLGDLLAAFGTGFQRDVFVALAEIIPLLFWMLIVRDRAFGSTWHRIVLLGGSFIFWFAQLFLLCVEFFFFEEFRSRFNTVAVDYLLYPYEVFVNIWESYHVGVVIAACAALSLAWLFVASKLFCRHVGAALFLPSAAGAPGSGDSAGGCARPDLQYQRRARQRRSDAQ